LKNEYVRAGAKCDDSIINLIGCNNSRCWRLALDLDQMVPMSSVSSQNANKTVHDRRAIDSRWALEHSTRGSLLRFEEAYFVGLSDHPQVGAHPSDAGGIS
jgi:hypothetical protein